MRRCAAVLRSLLAASLLIAGCGRSDEARPTTRETLVSCEAEATLAAWSRDAGADSSTLAHAIVADDAESSCRLAFTTATLDAPLGRATATRPLDPRVYAGRRVRVRGKVRTDHTSGPGAAGLRAAVLGLRAHGPTLQETEVDLLDGSAQRWRAFELCLDVPPDTEALTLLMAQSARAETWLRDVTIEATSSERTVGSDKRPLRRPEHLVVFARVYGHLRYFYPAEASTREWSVLAADGVEVAERAEDMDALARDLERWAARIGPDIQIAGSVPAAGAPDPAGPGWRHTGVSGQRTTYRSEFVAADHSAPDVVVADVGGGLHIRYPRAFTGQTAPLALDEPPALDACAERDRSRSNRLAVTVMMWSLLEHFYPHHELMLTDWPAALRVALPAAAAVGTPSELIHVLRRMLAELRDNHVRLWYGPEPRCRLPLGWRWIEDRLVMTSDAKDGSFRRGDVVEQIDGIDAGVRIAEVEAEVSAATPAAQRDLTLRRLRDEPAGPLTTLSLRTNGEGRRVTVRCAEGSGPSEPGEPIRALDDGILVVRMDRIDRRFTADQLDRMARAPGLLFDLRPSSDASPALPHLTSAPLFGLTYASVLTAFPGAAGRSRTETQRRPIEPRAPLLTAPAAFLVDERATSASESALAHVHQHRLGPVFGANTAGTTCDVNQIWFPDGYLVRWTGCLALWDSGDVFHGTGVPASDPVQPTLAGVAAGRDEVLESAAEWVRAQAALRP